LLTVESSICFDWGGLDRIWTRQGQFSQKW
jgi:hypothetical protein